MAIHRRKKSRILGGTSRSGVVIVAVLLFSVFSIYYFTSLYKQVEEQFNHAEQSLPTRVFSDLSQVMIGMPKLKLLNRLEALGYNVKTKSETIQFELRPLDYPSYLLPEGHPQSENYKSKKTITIQFQSADLTVSEILMNDQKVNDIFLEPELIATLAKKSKSIRDTVPFPEFPANIWQAIIAIEDQHFLEHSGFDPTGLLRAAWINLKTLSFAQGGSTLTQQLVKNLTERRGKNLYRKINELFLAMYLEIRFSKEQILERYLNEVYLGQAGGFEVHGVAEGAKLFFGKNLKNLNLAEMALLAGLIRGPGFYSPYKHKDRALERMRLVLKKMVETGHLAEQERLQAIQLPIRLAPPQNISNRAPYFLDLIKTTLLQKLSERFTEEEIVSGGFKVYSTLDLTLNQIAQNTVAAQIPEFEKKLKKKKIKKAKVPNTAQDSPTDRLEGILVSVDPRTGFIKALVGGRSYSESNYNRVLNMKRQVGSTFKPIVYLAALEKKFGPNGAPYTGAYPLEDSQVSISYDSGRQTWSPKNYEPGNVGWTTLRSALAHSINTVAAKLAMQTGLDEIINLATRLGVKNKLIAVPSIALGTFEMSIFELLNVYIAISNHGLRDEPTSIRAVTLSDGTSLIRHVYQPTAVLDPALADLMTDILTSVFTEGTALVAKNYKWDRPSAGKTGTTSDYRDSWFIGYTPELLTLTWVGTDQDQSPYLMTGSSAALPIWVDYMKGALKGQSPSHFQLDSAISEADFDTFSGNQATDDCSHKLRDKGITSLFSNDHKCEFQRPESITEINAP